jgi:5-methylcytosine-specific restriction enzyme A
LAKLPNANTYHWHMAEDGRSRPPDWEWEEIVLACDLVVRNGGRFLDHEDRRVVELSELLQRMTLHPREERELPRFRNANGVAQKTRNIAQHYPGFTGSSSHGNRLDREVMQQFIDQPGRMHALAESIRSGIAVGESPDFPREVGYENESEMEGRYLLRLHAYRERNPKLRRRKIKSVLDAGEPLACQVCHFDFAEVYGRRGQGYIECHHIEPLHVGGEKARSLDELALLCSNCHRMIHTKPPWPTPDELRELIERQARS